MFSWISIHEETADRICSLAEPERELLATLRAMEEAGLTVISLEDSGPRRERLPLADVDPLTFLASFNRGITDDNRRANWSFLKTHWKLKADLPVDFDGIPIVHNMKSWFFPYARKRDLDHIGLLWKLVKQAVNGGLEGVDGALFDRCIELPMITTNKLTIGLFWCRPTVFLPADKKTQAYVEHLGVTSTPGDWRSYRTWVREVAGRVDKSCPQISLDAHRWITGEGEPGQSHPKGEHKYWLIAPGEKASEWEQFHDSGIVAIDWTGMPDLAEFASREEMGLRLQRLYPSDKAKTNDSLACWEFCNEMAPGDVVFAKQGIKRILGAGVIQSDYTFDEERDSFNHVRRVQWGPKGSWEMPSHRSLPLKTLTDVTDDAALVKILTELNGLMIPETFDGPKSTGSTGKMRFWWLNANPKIWSLADAAVGSVQTYSTHNDKGNKRQRYRYFHEVKPGDLVIGYATNPAMKIVSICEITRGIFQGESGEEIEFKKVEHLDRPVLLEELRKVPALSESEPFTQAQGSLFRLTPAEYESIRALIDETQDDDSGPVRQYSKQSALAGLFLAESEFDELLDSFREKKNLVLQGAPGVGKTFIAKRLAFALMAEEDPNRVQMVQFHQSYSYEDFVQGFRPTNKATFELKNGIFHQFCRAAQREEQSQKPYVFIIDEINRGNLSRIFGELMMLIESDKRGSQYRMPLTYSPDEEFYVPSNVHLLGLMNTADRSLAMVDYALRRRFRFMTLEPQFNAPGFRAQLKLAGASDEFVSKVVSRMSRLNEKIVEDKKNLGVGYRIGHSFFCPPQGTTANQEWYRRVIESEILPLIREYWLDEEKEIDHCRAILFD